MREFEHKIGGRIDINDVGRSATEVATRFRIEPYKDNDVYTGRILPLNTRAEKPKSFLVDQSLIDTVKEVYGAIGAEDTAKCIINALFSPDTSRKERQRLIEHIQELRCDPSSPEDALAKLIKETQNGNGNGKK